MMPSATCKRQTLLTHSFIAHTGWPCNLGGSVGYTHILPDRIVKNCMIFHGHGASRVPPSDQTERRDLLHRCIAHCKDRQSRFDESRCSAVLNLSMLGACIQSVYPNGLAPDGRRTTLATLRGVAAVPSFDEPPDSWEGNGPISGLAAPQGLLLVLHGSIPPANINLVPIYLLCVVLLCPNRP